MLKKILITIVVLIVFGAGGLLALIYFHDDNPNAPKHLESKKIPLVVPDGVTTVPTKTSPVSPVSPVKPATTKEVKKAPVKVAKSEPVPAPVKTSPAIAVEGNWIINVASFTESAPSKSLSKKLNDIGLLAYTTEFMKDGTQWYRVRVGFYPSKEKAQNTATRIKNDYSYTGWITKASDAEKQKHLK